MNTSKGIACGTVLLLCAFFVLTYVSQYFVYGQAHALRPIPLVIGLLLLAWVGFFLSYKLSTLNHRNILWFIFGVGFLVRVCLLFSNPIQEDDFYRYMWDGNVMLSGHNPYAVAPAEALLTYGGVSGAMPIHDQALLVKKRINYASISTIYPPLAQVFFMVTQRFSPWRIMGFRLCLLGVEVICFILLIMLLGQLRLPRGAVYLYFWNPLVIKETINSMHYDILCACFVLATMLCLSKQRYFSSVICLLLAFFSKLTPLLLLPIMLLFFIKQKQKQWIWGALGIFLVATGLFFGPWGWASGIFSGLTIFSEKWVINSSLFASVTWLFAQLGLDGLWIRQIIKWLLGVGLCVGLYQYRYILRTPEAVCHASFLMLMGLFLISPCGNPWYLVWAAPLLAITRSSVGLALYPMLSFYYLIFYMDYQGFSDYLWIIPWIEYGGAVILFVIFFYCRHVSSHCYGVASDLNKKHIKIS